MSFTQRSADSPGTTINAGTIRSGPDSHYALTLLSPGVYQIMVRYKDEYQAQEINDLELAVASALDLDFALRPLGDVWAVGTAHRTFSPSGEVILHYYAADVENLRSANIQLLPATSGSLEPSISYVIDPATIQNLPLAGRDVYATLAMLPGVSSDTSTGRGLGITVNGQRPASSNFLLDGVENNNVLITGPLTSLAPELIQEYRVSTDSWSAEYGRTIGYLANAISRAGGEVWHGTVYFNLKNDALNASDFQDNAHKLPRSPLKEAQYGFQAGGPVWKKKLFVSTGLEIYRSRSYQPAVEVKVPSPQFAVNLSDDNPGRALLTDFPTPATDPGDGLVSELTARPTVSINRYSGLARADFFSGSHHVLARIAINRLDWPDFIWYPYKDFTSGLEETVASTAVEYIGTPRPGLTHEARASWNRSTVRWDRAHPEIPTLVITTSLQGPDDTLASLGDATLLPGSPALYGLRYTQRSPEFTDNLMWTKGRHIAKVGGGLFFRDPDGLETVGRDGRYTFTDVLKFLTDNPATFTAALGRSSLPEFQQPSYEHSYRNLQYSGFAEDTWRLGRRFVLNGGIRYDNFGAPSDTGTNKDAIVQLGGGRGFPQELQGARIVYPSLSNQKLWNSDNGNIAPRFGFAWDGQGHAPVIRGGYGIFFDHPFDNLWTTIQNNGLVVPPGFNCSPGFVNLCANYLAPVSTILTQFKGGPYSGDFPSLTLIDPKLRSGYAQNYFVGLQERISDVLAVELNALGSLGRDLVTTDVVNRVASTAAGRYNPNLPNVLWRSNEGSANYNAVTATARYRSRRGFAQFSWTWSHAIDNQSDPLAGEFFDLSFVNFANRAPSTTVAGFARQFDSRADRGSANFDQRHNLVFLSWFDLPALRGNTFVDRLTRDWRVSEVAAVRAGFPYSVLAPATGALIDQRANMVNAGQIAALPGAPAAAGSVALLNPSAFANPPAGVLGNTGRNAFRGPGLWNADISVSRIFNLRQFGERGRLVLRANFYNAFNHANLNNPVSLLSSPAFGQASYGRLGYDTGFPALTPLNETARQIQITMKVAF